MIKYIVSLIFIFLSVCIVILGIMNYNSRYSDTPDKEPFSFLNQFPYELQDNPTMKYNFLFRIIAALLGGSYICFGCYLFWFKDMYGLKNIHDYILGVLMTVNGIAIFSEFVITLKAYRKHLMFTSLLFSLTVMIYAYLGFYVLIDARKLHPQILAYIVLILAAALLASLIFTPLKRWMYLEKEEEDGRITYHRKRLSILPFMEWIFLASNVLLIILLTIF